MTKVQSPAKHSEQIAAVGVSDQTMAWPLDGDDGVTGRWMLTSLLKLIHTSQVTAESCPHLSSNSFVRQRHVYSH